MVGHFSRDVRASSSKGVCLFTFVPNKCWVNVKHGRVVILESFVHHICTLGRLFHLDCPPMYNVFFHTFEKVTCCLGLVVCPIGQFGLFSMAC